MSALKEPRTMIEALILASGQDRPIAGRIEDMERVAAEVFVVPGGVGFADIGWNSPYPGANPFHIVHGLLESSGERFWTFIEQTGRTIQFWLKKLGMNKDGLI